jgi:hypothetical protein
MSISQNIIVDSLEFSEYWIRKKCKGSGHDLISEILTIFTSRDRRKLLETSIKIFGYQAEIRTGHHQNKNQKHAISFILPDAI